MGVWKYNFVLLFEISLHLRSGYSARARGLTGSGVLWADRVQYA